MLHFSNPLLFLHFYVLIFVIIFYAMSSISVWSHFLKNFVYVNYNFHENEMQNTFCPVYAKKLQSLKKMSARNRCDDLMGPPKFVLPLWNCFFFCRRRSIDVLDTIAGDLLPLPDERPPAKNDCSGRSILPENAYFSYKYR